MEEMKHCRVEKFKALFDNPEHKETVENMLSDLEHLRYSLGGHLQLLKYRMDMLESHFKYLSGYASSAQQTLGKIEEVEFKLKKMLEGDTSDYVMHYKPVSKL